MVKICLFNNIRVLVLLLSNTKILIRSTKYENRSIVQSKDTLNEIILEQCYLSLLNYLQHLNLCKGSTHKAKYLVVVQMFMNTIFK